MIHFVITLQLEFLLYLRGYSGLPFARLCKLVNHYNVSGDFVVIVDK